MNVTRAVLGVRRAIRAIFPLHRKMAEIEEVAREQHELRRAIHSETQDLTREATRFREKIEGTECRMAVALDELQHGLEDAARGAPCGPAPVPLPTARRRPR